MGVDKSAEIQGPCLASAGESQNTFFKVASGANHRGTQKGQITIKS